VSVSGEIKIAKSGCGPQIFLLGGFEEEEQDADEVAD
jgi:hypothetical protein